MPHDRLMHNNQAIYSVNYDVIFIVSAINGGILEFNS